MKAELVRLLREAGVSSDIGWRDLVVLYNYAPVPPPRGITNDMVWNRGFNLVVLSDGRPTYFVKCRPTGDRVIAWDTAIRSCLAGERPGGLSVTEVNEASSERLTIQVSPFLQGIHYGRIVKKQSTGQYIRSLRIALNGASVLADLALRCPALPRESSATVNLSTMANDIIGHVASLATLSTSERDSVIAAVTAVGDVPSRPQHGDFWWQNLISVEGELWAIDFDSYGAIRVPLFDDLTLVLTTISLRASGAVEGLERLVSDNGEARACRQLLVERAAAEGLDSSQLDGLLVYYLTNIASTVHRRGGMGFAAPHIAAARRAAELLLLNQRLLPVD